MKKAALINLLMCLVWAALPASARVVNFDFADGETDVEFFPGLTANAELDLATNGRVQVDASLWMEVRVTDSGGTPIHAHVNNVGIGGVNTAGAVNNQLSDSEKLTVDFYDASAGGNPVSVNLTGLTFGNFGGTAGGTDGIIVQAGSLPDITIAANTGASGTGFTYTQLSPTAAQGTGQLQLNPAVSLNALTLTDHSTGAGGSRLNQLVFNSPTNGVTNGVPNPAPGAPNVIYIMADDMGYSDPHCYGSEIDTPNIDRLAAEGLRFRQFYNNAKCETTRCALMSGLYHGRCGLQMQNGTTLGAAMQSGGYRTYAVGKWHLGEGAGQTPADRGFHNYYGFYGGASSYFPTGIGANTIKRDTQESNNFVSAYSASYFTPDSPQKSRQTSFPPGFYLTDGFGDNAVAFINDAVSNHAERPFFMYVAFNAPHTPLQAPVDLINKYRPLYTNGWDVLRQQKWQRQLGSGLADPVWQLSNRRDDIPAWNDLDAASRDLEAHRRAVYAAMVDSVDQNVGKILARLDALEQTHPGIVSNTLVIFTGDNGAQAFDNTTASERVSSPDNPDSGWNEGSAWAALSNTPWRYYKQSQQQGGICTPFVARWPKIIAPGKTTDQPGHVVDIMATLLDIGSVTNYSSLKTFNGNPVPPPDGASLLPIFAGGTRPMSNYWGFEFNSSEFAVIQGDWKLASFSSSPWRLFNLREDRTETRNLRWDNPQKVQELAGLYDQWATDTYGNTSRTYANRDTLAGLSQELRYEAVQTGQLYRNPSVAITVTNIGGGASAIVDDHWEIVTVQSAAAGIGGAADDITFVCKPFFGDGEVIAEVDSLANALAAAQAGVMVRESFAPGSPFVMTGLNPAGQVAQSVRAASNGAVAETPGGSAIATPVFLRVKRVADIFTTAYSTNGLSWVNLATATNAMSVNLYAGLVANSGGSGTTATLTFREWENRHVLQYPQRPRLVDGLPELLGYALGADLSTDARNRQPFIRMTNVSSSTFPELNYVRRKNTNGLSFGYLGGATPNSLVEDSANWVQTGATPWPDADSERVSVRRLIDAQTATNGFFRLKVNSP